jgi:ribose 5-phosphate isomerase A
MSSQPVELRAAAERAVSMIRDGDVVGLGTGHAANTFLHALAERMGSGLSVRGLPTSATSAELARRLGIPLVDLAEVEAIDIDVDGADEVDPQGNLVKGFGGALLREKVVAAESRSVVIVVGPEKIVPVLGSRGRLPVEIVPFAAPACRRRLAALGWPAELRRRGADPFVTDNGNHIFDCRVGPIEDPHAMEASLRAIPGVVATGLFLNMTDTVIVQEGANVDVREYPRHR